MLFEIPFVWSVFGDIIAAIPDDIVIIGGFVFAAIIGVGIARSF